MAWNYGLKAFNARACKSIKSIQDELYDQIHIVEEDLFQVRFLRIYQTAKKRLNQFPRTQTINATVTGVLSWQGNYFLVSKKL